MGPDPIFLNFNFNPTGDMVNARCSRASPPSGVVTLSMSKLESSIAITIFISRIAR